MLQLADLVADHDGVSPLNEATRIALSRGEEPRVMLKDEIVGAVGFDDAPVELFVHPRYRRQGRGTALVKELLSLGEKAFWAHGDLPGAQQVAEATGLEVQRILLVLRTVTKTDVPQLPTGLLIRPFEEQDVPEILAINAQAFADHPEQGAMDRADFDARREQAWFDPAGLFVAEREGEVLGFHWTKTEDDVGEVYVVGVSPTAHGAGVGTALTAWGLAHLWENDVSAIDLYVEGDNEAALAVYRKLGFNEHARDVLYAAG